MLWKSNVKSFVAALSVFLITMATVRGPTPPGTGVTIPATWHTWRWWWWDREVVEQGSEVVEINIEKHILLYLFKGDITHNLVVGQSCDAWEEGGRGRGHPSLNRRLLPLILLKASTTCIYTHKTLYDCVQNGSMGLPY